MPERMVVAMSGGVDSSVAAALMKEAGHDVVGITMRVVPCAEDGSEAPETVKGQRCCTALDVEDARRAAAQLGIPHYVLNVKEDFKNTVLDPFLAAYASGRTPVPCAPCNHSVKFGALLDHAESIGAASVVTGHYARVDHDASGRARLLRPSDRDRDQTYFLAGMTPAQLSKVRFPLGELTKAEVRRRARAAGLPNADKPDSQEICFIPDGDTRNILLKRLGTKPGRVVDVEGRVVGEHAGAHLFTIGQRKGLGIFVPTGRAWFVVGIDPESNTVTVGSDADLFSPGCVIESANWLTDGMPSGEVEVRIRSRHPGVSATLSSLDDGFTLVRFASPQRAVTPGQTAVISAGDVVLGGGVIRSAWRPTAVPA